MTGERPSYWDPAKRAAYLDTTAEKAAASKRRKDGEATAEALDLIWAGLGEPERALIEALLISDRHSFVALHDHPALRDLVSKGLLAYPRGQGGNWMRAAKTSYSVPPAVWKRLQHLHHGTKDLDTPAELAARGAAKALLERIANEEQWQG